MKSVHPAALVILDGFGYSVDTRYNAIAHARMPHFNNWWAHYPHALLAAAGEAVGLPDNLNGNSEVGHLTIGSGRIIPQPMKIWLESIENGSFAHDVTMIECFKKLQCNGGALHIMGLLSDAGVHGHEIAMLATIAAAAEAGIKKIVVHAFLDGRDTPPQSAHVYLQRLAELIKHYDNGASCHIIIGSIHGRFYAMDRDNNWDRIEKSYRVLTEKGNGLYNTWEKVLERNYAHNITDEFIPPTQLSADGVIHNGDGIFFCNVRPDRARELTHCFMRSIKSVCPDPLIHDCVALRANEKDNFSSSARPECFCLQKCIEGFILKPLTLTFFITPTEYDVSFPTTVLFPRRPIQNTLKDVLAHYDKTIFTCAETEKYAHVTYFFRGENEEPVATETRIMIPSLHTQNYVKNPHMSAEKITATVLKSLRIDPCDFYLINYANADMVGHSGDFDATVKAVECLDEHLQELYEVIVQKMDGTLYITADHGKAEQMYDAATGQPHTAHTSNPVPFLMITHPSHKASEGFSRASKREDENADVQLPLTQLADVAPFILHNMGLPVPDEMMK